jgi:aspartyl/asparaginyl-tRNA synthetase
MSTTASPLNVRIADLKNHVDQEVTLRGWLYNSRSSGKLLFLILRDGTGLCQCVLEKTDENAALFDEVQAPGAGIIAGPHRVRAELRSERRRA